MSERVITQYDMLAKKEDVVKSIRDVLEPYKTALDVSPTPRSVCSPFILNLTIPSYTGVPGLSRCVASH